MIFHRPSLLTRVLSKALLAWGVLLSLGASAVDGEHRALYRSIRMEALGGAFVGLADDESALFYNPAGLANSPDEFHYLGLDVEGSADMYSTFTQSLGAFFNPGLETINALMGRDTYARAQIAMIMTYKNLGLSYFFDAQNAFYLKNKALPDVTFGYQTTHGVQVGYAYSLLGGRRNERMGRLSIGASVKVLFRRGGYREMATTDLFRLAEGQALLNEVVGNWGLGIGGDLGILYKFSLMRNLDVQLGVAYRNIGEGSFTGQEGIQFTGGDAEGVEEDLGLGFSAEYREGSWGAILSYEHADLTKEQDWRKRNHLGIELKAPILSLYGGLNGLYFTFGVGFNLWLMRFYVGSWGEELGPYAYQNGDRRYGLRVDMKIPL